MDIKRRQGINRAPLNSRIAPLAKEWLIPEKPYGLMPYAHKPYEVPELWKSNSRRTTPFEQYGYVWKVFVRNQAEQEAYATR